VITGKGDSTVVGPQGARTVSWTDLMADALKLDPSAVTITALGNSSWLISRKPNPDNPPRGRLNDFSARVARLLQYPKMAGVALLYRQ
jgi:hypothetical protein